MSKLSTNGRTILEKRILTRDNDGNLTETPEECFRRVARIIAAPDRTYGASDAQVQETEDQFYDLMASLDFMPNSPTLANAGARTGQLSACFVLPIEDDLAGIFETMKHAALIHQTGGGTGFSFTRLRPKGAIVGSTKGAASGPVSFMTAFNAATEVIKQGGTRRGANMGILRIDHPDVLAFMRCKTDTTQITNFNISLAVTDAFMDAVEKGTTYALVDPRTLQEVGYLDARTVFRQLVVSAWETGEPGVVFIDRMNRYCPVPWMGQYEATNPCGEQPLIPYESCNLGSINLENFVKVTEQETVFGPATGTKWRTAWIDWKRLEQTVYACMHFLDNVIDANTYPIPELKRVADATRKIGLGVMGFARMLFLLGVPYGSPMSSEIAGQVMSFIDYHSKSYSTHLAQKRGQFPGRTGHEQESDAIYRRWCEERQADPSRHPDADYLALADQIHWFGIRNSTTTTIAPTGTISMFADTTSGCEPAFALAFKRWQAEEHMVEADRVFRAALEARYPAERVEAFIESVDQNHGSLHGLGLDADLTHIFKTAHDVSPEDHVNVQAAFQKFNDSATSKTINFAEHATVDNVMTAYLKAWETGCKGITVYRNNSRQFQPLSVTPAKPAEVLAAAPVEQEANCPNCCGALDKGACGGCGWTKAA